MLKFLKSILSNIIGMVIGFFLIISIGVVIIATISGGEGEAIIEENSVLKIKLRDQIIDRGSDTIFIICFYYG